MREQSEPLALMSASERESYLGWLARIIKGRKGSLAEKYRNAAREVRGQWSMS